MYRRIFSQKQKLVALAFVAFLGIILSGFVASVIAEALDNDVQVEPDSELTYYLKVKYDGVDKEGVQSNDATMAKINSGRIKVTDKIPDGLTFKSFVTSDNGSIGAVSRADSTVSCSGRVIDDTQEALNDTGVWNTDNSEYTYHGLHYDANSRTVSFYVESLKAGCELTVGIITQTPETVDNPATTVVETRRDFYNTALATEGLISAPSNTVHAFMGDKNAEMYKVTYAYKLARVKHATVGIATALISIQAGDCFIRCLHKIWETADKAVNAVLALPLNRHIQMPSLLHATPQTHPAPCSLP